MDKESLDQQRASIRRSLLQGINTTTSNTTRGGLTDTENAKNLAKRLFEYYNKDQSGHIADYEIGAMISDVYRAIGKEYNPSNEDIKQYIETVDCDKDGKVTIKDLEQMLIKYLV